MGNGYANVLDIHVNQLLQAPKNRAGYKKGLNRKSVDVIDFEDIKHMETGPLDYEIIEIVL